MDRIRQTLAILLAITLMVTISTGSAYAGEMKAVVGTQTVQTEQSALLEEEPEAEASAPEREEAAVPEEPVTAEEESAAPPSEPPAPEPFPADSGEVVSEKGVTDVTGAVNGESVRPEAEAGLPPLHPNENDEVYQVGEFLTLEIPADGEIWYRFQPNSGTSKMKYRLYLENYDDENSNVIVTIQDKVSQYYASCSAGPEETAVQDGFTLNDGTKFALRLTNSGSTDAYVTVYVKQLHPDNAYTFGTIRSVSVKNSTESATAVNGYRFTPAVSDVVVTVDAVDTEGGDLQWELRDAANTTVEPADEDGVAYTECSDLQNTRYSVTAGRQYTLYIASSAYTEENVTGTIRFSVLPRELKYWSAAASTCLYTGKARTPNVAVKYKGADLARYKGEFYKVSYSGNVAVTNKAAAKVTGIYPFSGTLTRYFTIIPKYTQIRSLKSASKRAVTITWAKPEALHLKQTSGYQVQYALNKSFTSGVKTISIGYNTTTSKKITGLTSGKYYYFRVRTYKRVNGTYVYSGWSTVKYVKVR